MDEQRIRLSEIITYSTVLIRCEYKNGTSGTGTGFVMHLCQDISLKSYMPVVVTNKHVVNDSSKCIFDFCKADKLGNPLDRENFTLTFEDNYWIQHPNPDVDLCCLPIAEAMNQLAEMNIELFYIPLTTNLIPGQTILNSLSAIEDIIMVGYPIGLSDTVNHKPVIRKGITASHIKYDYQGKKQFLIDCACFPGSSGSPVFILSEGGVFKQNNELVYGNRILFLGILFAGPQFTATGKINFTNLPVVPTPITNIPANLGFVIKSNEIFELEQYIKESVLKRK
ncbi:MAG: serine protease [Clostridiales bacterium]